MKIGIITFHFGYNYGATLQCLGLYKTLKEMGHEVDVIDYHPIEQPTFHFWQGWGLRKRNLSSNLQKRWVDLRYGGLMRKRFDEFYAQNLTFSERCDESGVTEVVAQYDALITGSDQVWNRSYSTVTFAYFLAFSNEYHGRKISYAACCGHKGSPLTEKVKDALLKFDAISVRNQVTYDWVRQATGLSAEIVCDPTLLIEYEEMDVPVRLPHEKYILAYSLGGEIAGGHRQAFEKIKSVQGNLPVVWVCPAAHRPASRCKWADHTVYDAGPAEWLSLIKNATFVYTDSFHGAVFSTKYERSFLAYYAEAARADRLMDFAKRYDVEGAVTGGLSDAIERGCFEFVPDYSKVRRNVGAHKAQSQNFLKRVLA